MKGTWVWCALALWLPFGCDAGADGSDPGPVSDVVAGDPGPDVPAGASLDGIWRLDRKVCNGTDVDITGWPETRFTIQGTSGSITNEFCSIPVTISYPSAGRVDWVLGQVDCQGSSQGTGDHHSATYTIAGSTCTLTEALTPADEYGCGSGAQVSTWTRI
jgi:hypothetical protein